jgi:hypothetical protein
MQSGPTCSGPLVEQEMIDFMEHASDQSAEPDGESTDETKEQNRQLAKWVDSIGTATLPVLAGFTSASVIVVADDAGNFRWPGWTILMLTIATLLLITSVQCASQVRPRIEDWSPQDNKPIGTGLLNWALGAQWTYLIGILALLAGLALAVAPGHAASQEDALRWCASFVAAGACVWRAVTASVLGKRLLSAGIAPRRPKLPPRFLGVMSSSRLAREACVVWTD